MILFWAGNFEYMRKVEREVAFGEVCIENIGSFNRLASFAFTREINNVMIAQSELKGTSNVENSRTEDSYQDTIPSNESEGVSAPVVSHRIQRRRTPSI